jgi:hypothetical protein
VLGRSVFAALNNGSEEHALAVRGELRKCDMPVISIARTKCTDINFPHLTSQTTELLTATLRYAAPRAPHSCSAMRSFEHGTWLARCRIACCSIWLRRLDRRVPTAPRSIAICSVLAGMAVLEHIAHDGNRHALLGSDLVCVVVSPRSWIGIVG